MFGDIEMRAPIASRPAPQRLGPIRGQGFGSSSGAGVTAYFEICVGSSGTQSYAAGGMYLVPFTVGTDIYIIDVAIDVNSTGASYARMGMYVDNGNYYPGALFQDFGLNAAATAINCNSTTGICWLGPLTIPVWVPPGLYWACLNCQSPTSVATGLKGFNSVYTESPYGFGSIMATGVSALTLIYWKQTGVNTTSAGTGTLPLYFPATRNPTTGEAVPRIQFKISG